MGNKRDAGFSKLADSKVRYVLAGVRWIDVAPDKFNHVADIHCESGRKIHDKLNAVRCLCKGALVPDVARIYVPISTGLALAY